MLKNYNQLVAKNLFSQSYKEFQDSSLYHRLESKFKPIPYYKKYQSMKYIALVSSIPHLPFLSMLIP